MSSRDPVQQLVTVLQERGINLGRDDVAWAFESAKTKDELAAWAGEYLDSTTLLTKDELDLYRSWGSTRQYATNIEQDIGRPLLEPELQAAIRSLEVTTASIEKQTRELENQRAAFEALKEQSMPVHTPPRDTQDRLRGQRLHESSIVGFTIDEISGAMTELLQHANAEITKAAEQLSSSCAGRLSAHDKVLEALSRLAEKTNAPTDHKVNPHTIDSWCRSLVALRGQETQARFDAMFLEQLAEHSQVLQNGHNPQSESERNDLQNEVTTLLDEISSVSEVVVAHEARQPLLRYMRASILQGQEEQKDWSDYIFSTMSHMTLQMEVLHQHAVAMKSYSGAMREVHKTFVDVNTNPSVQQNAELSRPSALSTPIAAPSNRMKDRATDQLLRRLNVVLPTNTARSAPGSGLDAAVEASQLKLEEQYHNASIHDLEALAQSMEIRDRDMQSALSKVYTSSAYKAVRLSEKALDSQLQALDDQIATNASVYAKIDGNKRFDAAASSIVKLKEQWSG